MKLKITCCYALYVIVMSALNSGNQKSSLTPLSVTVVTMPTGTADSVTSNGTATGITGFRDAYLGGNAGN